MVLTFCFSNFTAQNLKLQPWLTVYQIAKRLPSYGHQVHVVTDKGVKTELNGISVHIVNSLRGTNSRQIKDLLHSIHPDAVVIDVNPISLVTANWYQTLSQFRVLAYLSYPFYKASQILKAFPHLKMKERWEFGRHILIPRRLWTKRLISLFDAVICQSKITGQTINDQTRSKIPVHIIPPGIDRKLWNAAKETKPNRKEKFFLFVGAPTGIRGFFVLLDAFANLSDHDIRLKVLARGANEKTVKEIEAEVVRRNIQEKVLIKGGVLGKGELKKEMQSSAAVLLPFVLVQSELPVSIMESIACGTPVVVSDINGLASAVGDAGIVVPHGETNNLASVIQKLYHHEDLLTNLKTACYRQAEKMMSWDAVSNLWLKIIST
jgi:glycosyltransferase involved in cell wall biosynthesis